MTALTLVPGDALACGTDARGFLAKGSWDCFSPLTRRLLFRLPSACFAGFAPPLAWAYAELLVSR